MSSEETSEKITGPLLLIGCGKMGGALLSGWLEGGTPAERVHIVEPSMESVAGFIGQGAHHHRAVRDLPADLVPQVVLFAVKPQMMNEALADLPAWPAAGTVHLSIAAGKTLGYFRERLGAEAAVVRAMPNTPAAIGRGMSVLVADDRVDAAQRDLCTALMLAVGEVDWVASEALIDVVTALSGGGPAYVFLLVETLARAGVASGLPEPLAERLARVTVAGSGELLHRSHEAPEILRRNVTSPGGTTLEALKVLMADDGIQPLFDRAIAAATRRSRELAQ
ncbi:pyrroline-5-carboxylate reductase [Tistlia consotensis]|uniref:Pyrroline-5-carboxylate reductase n=1 Tax=Tistlia consotensis USBA 355 TaxID=560819 RepID=A0A1Y6C7F7_9PROT|nr:pyrroline-5-carboxylate reductase [Tistlia consotensis]SMF46138.1 pyrroline-5-carboxylate reductase [Tistlia consotensis USBA 355]SNR78864.1 pyrroline-5-carboxylate reductase [Tistlia consotensis]